MTPLTSATEVLQQLFSEISQVREGDLTRLGSLIQLVDDAPEVSAAPGVQEIRDQMARLTILSGDEFDTAYDTLKQTIAAHQGAAAPAPAAEAPEPVSLYEKLGGEATIKTVVEEFYTRVLGDPALAPVFEGVDMGGLKRHQALFISQALGGPRQYEGRDMAAAHAGLNITSEQFDAVGGHLQSTLEALGVGGEDVGVIMTTVGSLKEQIVSAAPAAPEPAAETVEAAPAETVEAAPAGLEDSQLPGMDQELFVEFVDEALSHLQSIELNILSLETDAGNTAIINSIFRPFHTIKGVSGFLGLTEINKLCHDAENLLDDARKGKLEITGPVSDVVLQTVDLLKEMIPLCRSSDDPPAAIKPYAERVEEFLVLIAQAKSGASAPPVAPAPSGKPLGEIMVESETITPDNLDEAISTQEEHGGSLGTILITDHDVKPIEVAQALRSQQAAKDEPTGALEAPTGTASENIRVRTSLLDQLMNLTGELVLGRNQLLRTLSGMSEEVHGLNSILHNVDRVTSEVQEAVMQTRMQPLAGLFSRFHRVIRDLSRSMNKKISFSVSGETVELDKTLIEALTDPLTHLIRNCADHGIEPPEKRVAAGKPETGRITLKAFHEGGKVHVTVADDGAGVDIARIKEKAVESSLITREKAMQMSDREALRLLFAPGFSTAQQVTGVSGRGVGMDVVLSNIEGIGGTVEISSELGKGTTFLLDLPLTLAIVPALIVSVGGQRFAIPQTNLVELVHLEGETVKESIQQVRGSEVYSLRGELLPLMRLDEVLNLERQEEAGGEDGQMSHYALKTAARPKPEEAEEKSKLNLYEKLGGGPTIRKVVEEFYSRILADGELAPVFEKVDMHGLKRHQALFISQALGGPKQYDGRDMTAAHADLNISSEQFDRVGGHLADTLAALGVEEEDAAQIMGTVGSLKEQVVSGAAPAQDGASPQDAAQGAAGGEQAQSLTEELRAGLEGQQQASQQRALSIVVMSTSYKQYGLIVDSVYDTEEIVVKPLSNLLKDVGVFAGATLMGDGRAALILDMTGLVKAAGVQVEEEGGADSFMREEAEVSRDAESQTILLFSINPEEQMAVPLTLISRLETVRVSDIRTSINGKVIPYRDRLLPLAFLEEHVEIGKPPPDRETAKILVFEIEHTVGLVVSEIIDSVEIPVNLDDTSIAKRGFSGVGIVSGNPTAFLDIYQVIEMAYPDWFKHDKEKRQQDMDKTSITVMLAEDSSFYRNVEKNYLMQEGFNVIEAEDGQAAFRLLQQHPVDIVVTDIEMPNMNGFELTEHIRASEQLRHLPVIAVTSLSQDEERQRGMRAGLDAYLVKLKREELLREVHRLLKEKRKLN